MYKWNGHFCDIPQKNVKGILILSNISEQYGLLERYFTVLDSGIDVDTSCMSDGPGGL